MSLPLSNVIRLRRTARILSVALLGISFSSSMSAFAATAPASAASSASAAAGGKASDTAHGTPHAKVGSAPASAASGATQATSAAPAEARTYSPRYLPAEIEFSSGQVDSIRAAAAKQMQNYYEALAEGNRVATQNHALWLENARQSNVEGIWAREHARRVFARHAFYSAFIFWVVIAIVALALVMTLYQFMKDSRNAEQVMRKILRNEPAPKPDEPVDQAAATVAALVAADSIQPLDPGAQVPKSAQAPPQPITTRGQLTPEQRAAALAIYNSLRSETKVSIGANGLQLGSQFVGLVILGFALAFFYLYLDRVYPITLAQPAPAASAAASK